MPKLLIISLNGDPLGQYGTEHAGGQVKYILELGRYLVREGWEIDVFTIRNGETSKESVVTEGFNIVRFSLPNEKDYSYSISEFDITTINTSIASYVIDNKCQYNLLLCCYWLSGIVGLSLREIIQRKMLMSFCSLGYFKRVLSDMPESLDARIETEKYIAQNCDHIIATSSEEKNVLIAEYRVSSDKISVIPRGVDLNVFYKY